VDEWTTKPHLIPGTKLASVWMNQGQTGFRVGASARTIVVVSVNGQYAPVPWILVTPLDHHGRESAPVYLNMALVEEVTLLEDGS